MAADSGELRDDRDARSKPARATDRYCEGLQGKRLNGLQSPAGVAFFGLWLTISSPRRLQGSQPNKSGMSKREPKEPVRPAAMSRAELAQLLTNASRLKVTEKMIGADVAAGAPTNGDGTLNLIHYAAWLAANSKD